MHQDRLEIEEISMDMAIPNGSTCQIHFTTKALPPKPVGTLTRFVHLLQGQGGNTIPDLAWGDENSCPQVLAQATFLRVLLL